MKWWKKWSFVMILAITGIIYYGATGGIQKLSGWLNAYIVGDMNPGEDSETQQESSVLEGNEQTDPPEESEDSAFSAGVPIPTATPEPESLPEEPEPTATPEPQIRIGRVEDDYFGDALFLGDSRTVGLHKYGAWGETATFYASTGMTIYKLFNAEIVEMPDQPEPISVEEALQHQSFRKIYIMMGINEVGQGTAESFAQTYGEAIAHIDILCFQVNTVKSIVTGQSAVFVTERFVDIQIKHLLSVCQLAQSVIPSLNSFVVNIVPLV